MAEPRLVTSPCGHQDGLIQDVGVDLVEGCRCVCGMPPPLMTRIDGDAVLLHAFEDDAGVEGGAFDGGEEFVLRRCG